MKILNREEFLKLPSGTVYVKYEPYCFGDLCIKHQSYENDWIYVPLSEFDNCDDMDDMMEKLDDMRDKARSIPELFDCTQRDGLFEQNQLFAIYELKDVITLINVLKKTIGRIQS